MDMHPESDEPRATRGPGRPKAAAKEPKKASGTSSGSSGKRRRGRPRKVDTDKPEATRGPGRPKGAASKAKKASSSSSASSGKRRRGRPRKSEAASGTNSKPLVTCALSESPSANSGQESMNCPEIKRPAPGVSASETDECGRTALHRAAEDGDLEKIKELLDRGWDTRARDGRGRTPLHSALGKEKEAAAELLADADCIIDVQDEDEYVPLQLAAMKGFVGVIRRLLAAGADTRSGSGGYTPLHFALDFKRKAAAELLLDADCITDIANAEGRTPLHLAAGAGFVGAVRKLLAAGADTRAEDEVRRTPLHYAMCEDTEAAAELLAGADGEIDHPDEEKDTPLLLAAGCGFTGVVRKLLWSGARPDRNDEGWGPLNEALFHRRDDAAKAILAWCALRGVALNWGNCLEEDIESCIEFLPRCEAEVRRMKDARVAPGSRWSYLLCTEYQTPLAKISDIF
ncbi:ankyrin repeat and protein kinase domain-containing protein 1-like [Uloborus diversus]|uniref:ankyrin repeat and protein kinase domain-containing protein 1-like n=1 Tax=Uloborus diversus TaxID=327109 RepID=UPI00240A5B8E|nr:ankyrin repeat and protein kinase domain-containing protein 1-like [Uloborus diversus]